MANLRVLPHPQTFMMNRDVFLKNLASLAPLQGKTICVALSGGPDSVALLKLLVEVKDISGFSLFAVHVNHLLRGAESDRDEQFCSTLCKQLGVSFQTFTVDVKAKLKKGESVELCARRLRYSCFEKLSCDYVATAHHANDSIETFMLNFSRGSGLNGLCGIPAVRGRYLRPLLPFSRSEILDYLKENGLSFVTDSTNLSAAACNRNYIRHRVIPMLKKLNPSLEKTAVRNFSLLKQDADFLNQTANAFFISQCKDQKIKTSALRSLHPAVCSRVILLFLNQQGLQADYNHLEQIMALLGTGKTGRVQLGEHDYCAVRGSSLVVFNDRPRFFQVDTELVLRENFEKKLKINNLLLKNAIDYDRMLNGFKFRTRQPGDRMTPAGKLHSKPIRRLQAEAGLLAEQRENLPLAVDAGGIVWGFGIGVADRVAVCRNTKKILIFKINDGNKNLEV